ncbi:hypothetical protein NLI96_g1093 [Meripilus lineatus]|uniref:Response regulatory domain-containing protein n=1 Tax=Meripilus lineatus TaxID=2056292 RepID=A0AAD5VB64_9APHY|nr:hypothetical protein NLI96_g1093 [Physisporinus lineatus]
MSTSEEDSLKHDLQRAGTTGRSSAPTPFDTASSKGVPSSLTRPQTGESLPLDDLKEDLVPGHRTLVSPLPAHVNSPPKAVGISKPVNARNPVTGSDCEPKAPPISTKTRADAPSLPDIPTAETHLLGQSTDPPSHSSSHKPLSSSADGPGGRSKRSQRDCRTWPQSPPVPANTTSDAPDSPSVSTAHAISQPPAPSSSAPQPRRVRVPRSTYVPAWAVPPRVLLVDDDAVNRTLSSKFLQVFGCTIDVAVDGLGAVDKMNVKKYDLVLMDIVMPRLDGLSATTIIRRFDSVTPIISMTSNSKPHEVLTYFSNGMNDILSKPFTKDGLLDMVEKHLVHLKVIRTMSAIPESFDTPHDLSKSPTASSSTSHRSSGSSTTSINISFSYRKEDQIQPSFDQSRQDEEFAAILESFKQRALRSTPEAVSPSGRKRTLDDQDQVEAPSEKRTPKKRRSKRVESS